MAVSSQILRTEHCTIVAEPQNAQNEKSRLTQAAEISFLNSPIFSFGTPLVQDVSRQNAPWGSQLASLKKNVYTFYLSTYFVEAHALLTVLQVHIIV